MKFKDNTLYYHEIDINIVEICKKSIGASFSASFLSVPSPRC
jgi:hypothetical protein